MVELFILMMERVGLIILLAFLLVNVPYFKRVLLSREKMSSKVQLILIFGLFAIISNFTGIEIAKNQIVPNNLLTYLSSNASIANTRTLVIGVSGLVGGPIVGSTVGLIAGFHRVIQGGGHSFFYGWLNCRFFREPHGKANRFSVCRLFCHCRSVHGNDSDDFYFLFQR